MRIPVKPILFATLSLMLIAGCGESYDKAAALRRAEKAIQNKQFEEATSVLREVIAHDPKDVEAHYKLGLAFALQNYPHRAWVQFNEVLGIDSTRVDAMEQLGMLAYAVDERSEAIHWLERTVELGVDKPFLFDTLAYLHFQEGTIESAKRWIRRAIQANPAEPRFRYKLGRYLHFIGSDEDARPLLERLTREYPTYWDAKLLLGRVYRRLGEEALALEVLTEAVPQGKPHHDHLYELGMARLKTDDAAGAIEAFQQSIMLKPDKAESRYGVGQAYLKSGDREKARLALDRFRDVEKANKAFKDQQDQFIADWQNGLIKEAAGDIEEAIAAYEAALTSKENDPGTLLLLWQLRRQLDDPIATSRALSDLEIQMQAESARFDMVAMSTAKRLSARGFDDKAIQVLSEVIELEPDNLPARHQLIRVYDRLGKAEERRAQYEALRRYSSE